MDYKMKTLVTGGAGFLGSHLCDKLISRGDEVICMDNYYTGRERNVTHLFDHERFQMINWDIVKPLNSKEIEADQIFNLACPAAPSDYNKDPEATLEVNTVGVQNVLNLAKKLDCPIFQASTVRVLDENVNGNPYITGKREAEKILSGYPKAKIARLNSTFGPGMRLDDSRVIPSFMVKALIGDDLVVYANRLDKFCYVDDMVDEIVSFMDSDTYGIQELGHPYEISISELAKLIITVTNSKSKIIVI
jgi:UDP-glucuronate decarboxylase